MMPARASVVMLAISLASSSVACNDALPRCPDWSRSRVDYRDVAKALDAASYFPPGLYSNVPLWKWNEITFGVVTPPERRNPYDSEHYRAAFFLQALGEESLYARRAEPDLHVYRVLTQSIWGGHWARRAEARGLNAWAESRTRLGCRLNSSDRADGFIVDMSEKELPVATWQAIDSCMEQYFWTVPMIDVKPPEPRKPREPGAGVADVGLMCDGPDMSLIEGVRGGEYHAIRRVRTSSTQSRDPLLACVAMIESVAER